MIVNEKRELLELLGFMFFDLGSPILSNMFETEEYERTIHLLRKFGYDQIASKLTEIKKDFKELSKNIEDRLIQLHEFALKNHITEQVAKNMRDTVIREEYNAFDNKHRMDLLRLFHKTNLPKLVDSIEEVKNIAYTLDAKLGDIIDGNFEISEKKLALIEALMETIADNVGREG